MDSSASITSFTEPDDTTANNQSSSSTTSSSAPAPIPQCANCTTTTSTTLKPCTKCHSVQYCSRDCLKADMKKHKKVCAAAAQLYAQTADFRPAVTRAVPNEGHRRGLQKWQFDT